MDTLGTDRRAANPERQPPFPAGREFVASVTAPSDHAPPARDGCRFRHR